MPSSPRARVGQQQLVTDRLQPFGVGTGDEAVVQPLELDSFLTQLLLGIFVAVQTQLGVVGKIRAKLQEEGAEVAIPTIQVIVIDHGGGADNPGISLGRSRGYAIAECGTRESFPELCR